MKNPLNLFQNGWQIFVDSISSEANGGPITDIAPVLMESLEERFLYDASPLAALVAPADPTDIVDSIHDQFDDLSELFVEAESTSHEMPADLDHLDYEASHFLVRNSDFAVAQQLVVIDERVEDYEQLIRDLNQGDNSIAYNIVLLSQSSDGIEQITSLLNGDTKYDAVHIISHGTEGRLQLGNSELNDNNIFSYQRQLSAWTSGLSFGADILIYGCDVASDNEGQLLIDQISEWTGADIAASDDLTGNSALGGDWHFEYTVGLVETDVAFSTSIQASWMGTLDITSSLVSHFEFEEGSGTTATDETGNQDGVLTNGPTYVGSGAVGNDALDFTGDATSNNATVQVADNASLDFSGDFSVAFWYNSSVTQVDGTRLVGSHDGVEGFSIFAQSDGSLNFFMQGTSSSSSLIDAGGMIADGNWHHVSATRSGNDFELYLDGVSVATANVAVGTISPSAPLTIGGTSSSSADYEGQLDDVRVYTRSLSASDVTELYNYTGTITVDTTLDTVDGTTTDVASLLTNKGTDGFISLREAIMAVNNDSGTDWTIEVGAGTYSFASGSGDSGGDFDIRNSMTIVGAGIGNTIIDANQNDRVFEVFSGTVTFRDMTIQDGSGNAVGSAIDVNTGTNVTVDTVRLFNNQTTTAHGGAVLSSGTLTVLDSVFDSNSSASGDGGAIRSSGVLTVERTTFENNSTGNGLGGAIYQSSAAISTIADSLFVGNSSTNASGGAIYSAGSLTITSTTFSGNTTNGLLDGSAVFVTNGTTTLQNVTVTGNTQGDQGAVRVTGTGTLNIGNTIIAGNSGATSNDLDAAGTVNDLGNNLIGDTTGQTDLFDGVNGNQVGTSGSPLDPLLGTLADNGGLTLTHALLAGSTAIDGGTNTGAPVADQRGTLRDATADIGAYEYVAPFIVTNTNDSGAGSLRQAITDANAQTGLDTINFAIAGAGVHTVSIDTELPYISDSVILDATTQAGGSFTTPLIFLTKGDSYTGTDTGAIVVQTSGTTISGFIIGGFADEGIEISGFGDVSDGDNNIIENNWIGFDAAGAALGNGEDGVLVTTDSDYNVIRNNVIANSGAITGATGDGIQIRDSSDNNWVWGNTFGLGTDGSTSMANAGHGIHISGTASNNLIGTNSDSTDDTLERNIISGNTLDGIYIDSSDGTIIAGNYIGTDSTGNSDRGNGDRGVEVNESSNTQIGDGTVSGRNIISGNDGGSILVNGGTSDDNTIRGNYIGLDATGTSAIANSSELNIWGGAQNTIIGGTTAGQRNVISGNTGNGIGEYGGTGTIVIGNYIGTDFTGLVAVGNTQSGVTTVGGVSMRIGGTSLGEGNVIAGHGNSGIYIQSTDGVQILGNYIGVGSDGVTAMGNDDGIHLEDNSTNIVIGGIAASAGNIIAYSSVYGVFINGNASQGNTVRGNQIFRNGGLGIDLIGNGATANDAGDVDTGPNSLQNWAVLNAASINDAGLFAYTIDTSSFASGTYEIDFYASTDRDGGEVEGARFLGTGGFVPWGNASYSGFVGGVTLAPGEYVTTVVTDAGGNSSEFSNYAVAVDSDAGGAKPSDLIATSTTGGGLSINQDGGDDIYLLADDGGALLGGLTSFTYETRFSTTDSSSQTLISYATSGNDNEFKLVTQSDGDLTLQVGSQGTTTSVFDFRTLADGAEHTVSFTWQSSNGEWFLYIDGVERGTATGLAMGQTIDPGGTLVLGNEQDRVGGGFDTNPYQTATLYDTRLFSNVRSAIEISASYRSTLPYDESGLIANWTFNDLSSDGIVTDSVSGNNLTVAHTAEAGFTASVAELTFSLDENSLAGTVVGSVYGTDAEREAKIASLLAADTSLTYSAETEKFYKTVTTASTWTNASTTALATNLNSVSGQLATIHSAAENEFVSQLAIDLNQALWLGASDAGTEGVWLWQQDGSDAGQFWEGDSTGDNIDGAFTDWLAGRPDNSGGLQHYLVLNATGEWNDEDDPQLGTGYIIEWDADEVLDATDALTYSIQSQTAAGAFTIDADSGQIIVANGSLLDYETNASHSVTIRVTDGDSNTYDEAFTVSLNNRVEDSSAPTNLSSGIELNTDGGNDAYLISGAGLSQSLASTTVEIQFAANNVPNETVIELKISIVLANAA